MPAGLPILDLTSTEEALRCAGLSEHDVRHQSVLDSGIEDDLQMELFSRVPIWQDIVTTGANPSAPLRDQMVLLALKNYCRWFCAVLLSKRWNSILQLKSDGKTRGDRFDRMDLDKMLAKIQEEKGNAWNNLVGLLPENLQPVRAVRPMFGVSSPTTDIVTEVATRE